MVNTVYTPNSPFRHFSKFTLTLLEKGIRMPREAKLSWILFAVYWLSSSISFLFHFTTDEPFNPLHGEEG